VPVSASTTEPTSVAPLASFIFASVVPAQTETGARGAQPDAETSSS
jgi:hypothetical protein